MLRNCRQSFKNRSDFLKVFDLLLLLYMMCPLGKWAFRALHNFPALVTHAFLVFLLSLVPPSIYSRSNAGCVLLPSITLAFNLPREYHIYPYGREVRTIKEDVSRRQSIMIDIAYEAGIDHGFS